MTQQREIAIIGMSGIFPGAKNINHYWQNILNQKYCLQDAPDQWAKPYFDPQTKPMEDLARIYTRKVGLLGKNAEFNPLEFGIPPTSVGGDPSHFLALKTAKEALTDANYLERNFNRERTGIILGKGSNPNRGDVTGLQYGFVLDQTIDLITQLIPELTSEELTTLREQLKSSLPPAPIERAPTLVSNVTCGRIANRLDLMGPNYLIDAACASSLIAVKLAMEELLNHRCDMMLAGGIQASMPPVIYQLFCQLNALSRTEIQPFATGANGTLLSEGSGFLVLKRLEDAIKDGDRIYALIKGVGMASDGKALGLLAPRLEGEILAIQRAYEETGIDCHSIDLIEAHGTGIPLGDITEIQALTRVFGQREGNLPNIAIGSVKSMIGHCIPASGMASLIKMTLALYYKTLPPSICEEINPDLNLETSPFYVNTETRPWIKSEDYPRRAGVNAFGFGGINTHVILEEYIPATQIPSRTPLPLNFNSSVVPNQWTWELLLFSGKTEQALINLLQQITQFLTDFPETNLADLAYTLIDKISSQNNYKLAILATNIDDLLSKINLCLQSLTEHNLLQSSERNGIFYSDQAQDLGKIAFVFSSEGSQYVNMLKELCLYFPQVRQWFDLLDQAFPRQNPPSHLIFPPPTALTSQQKQWQENQLYAGDLATESLFAASMGIYELLWDFDIKYDVILGHSAGEHTAATASYLSKVTSKTELISHLRRVNQIYQELNHNDQIITGVVFSVGNLSAEIINDLLENYANSLFLVANNCPNQTILFATNLESKEILNKIQELGGIYIIQPFNRAYHTPLFNDSATALKNHYQDLKLENNTQQLYSCATTLPYPKDREEIRKLALEQWSMPVKFQETINTLYQQGVRTFIEVGANHNLTTFIHSILQGKNYQAYPTNKKQSSDLKQFLILLAQLFINNYPLKVNSLYQHRQVKKLNLDLVLKIDHNPQKTPILNMLLPKMTLKPEFVEDFRKQIEQKKVNSKVSNNNSDNQRNIANEFNNTSKPNLNLPNLTNNSNNQELLDIDDEIKSLIVQNHFKLMQEFLDNQSKISSMVFKDE